MAFPDLTRPSILRFLLGPRLPQNSNGFQGAHIVGNSFWRGAVTWLSQLGFSDDADTINNGVLLPESERGSAVLGAATHLGNHFSASAIPRARVRFSCLMLLAGLAACTPPKGGTRDNMIASSQEGPSVSDDNRAERKAALEQLDQLARNKGLRSAKVDEAQHPGFAEGESYTNPGVEPDVSVDYPIVSDGHLPGRYTVISTQVEQKLAFTLRTLRGEVVATVYVLVNGGKPLPSNEITLRVYSISEKSNLSAEGASVRSRLTMRRFASTIVALSGIRRSSPLDMRVFYERKKTGELL